MGTYLCIGPRGVGVTRPLSVPLGLCVPTVIIPLVRTVCVRPGDVVVKISDFQPDGWEFYTTRGQRKCGKKCGDFSA